MKNVLIISSSLRNGSNSEELARSFLEGCKENNQVEFVSLKEKKIGFCKGCLACQETGKCVIKDDALEIIEKVKKADVVVFSSPLYYYGMTGQLKTLLDRMNPLYGIKDLFKEVYLITVCADDNPDCFSPFLSGFSGFLSCFEGSKFIGILKGNNLNDPFSVKENKKLLQEAYEMGVKIR